MIECLECKAAGVDHAEQVKTLLADPLQVGIQVCQFGWLDSVYHHVLGKWFLDRYNAGKKRFIIVTPRDHLKTTMFVISLIVWRIIQNPTLDRILLRMASQSNAEKSLAAIQEILQSSPILQHYFPHKVLQPDNPEFRSTATLLRYPRPLVVRENTVEARAIRSRIVGGHYTWQINDDLVDEDMVNSDVEQQRVVDRIKRSEAMFVDSKTDYELIIGTRWPGLFYRWLLEDSGLTDTYETLVIGAEVDDRWRKTLFDIGKKTKQADGDPVWPEHFTREQLDLIQRKDAYTYQHQWLNIEPDEGIRRFQEQYFQSYNLTGDLDGVLLLDGTEIKFRDLYITMTVDPATGEHSKTDQSAIVVCGFHRQSGRIFVLYAWDGRALPHDLVKKIIEVAREWKPALIAPEDVAFQKTFKHFLKQEMTQNKLFIPIRPVKPGTKSKGARIIDALQPFAQSGQIYMNNTNPGQRRLKEELVTLQVVAGKVIGRSPNLADAMAYHAEFWKHRSVPRDEEEDDIPLAKHRLRPKPYGLECTT